MTTIGEMGEHKAISRLIQTLGSQADLVVGAGDDCAVCRMPGSGFEQVFTTDPVVENVHFLPGDEPERVGNKAVGRVLSDIAAMGAQPQWILVNVVAPPEQDFRFIEGIYRGMSALCTRFGATIIGGDLAKGTCLELHLFGTGVLPRGTALLRSGARPGDAVFVTGKLGCSLGGKHLDFMPRVEEGSFLRDSGLVNAMMDVSDGLATDLRHILGQSGVGAELDAATIPRNGTLEQALFDGEDFELLLTTAQPDALAASWPAHFGCDLVRIGSITAEQDALRVDGRLLAAKAFEHFQA